MGKTRLEELFYELYASSKRHDSWQRHAMIVELRDLMKQPKGSRSDHFERALDDEELIEIKAETKSSGIEDRAVENEANSKAISAIVKEESIPQSKVSIPQSNSEILKNIEPGKVDLGLEKLEHVVMNEVDGDVERGQEAMSNTKICSARQLFDQMTSKGKRSKYHKAWKFKFKRKSLVGIKLQIEQYKLSKMRMMSDSWSMRQPTLKIMKSHKKHKWKSKQLQIASNFWINHSHKLADLVLRTALTDWRTKNSKGLAYDGCVSLEINLAGFGRGTTELLATSQMMQKINLFSTMLLRVQSKKKQRKGPKSWMFKFKTDSKSARTNHILHQEKKPSKSPKSWKFKFKSENLRKMEVKSVLDNREAVVSVVGEVLFQHSYGLSNRLHRQDLQDLQQFITFGEVTFPIEHKWKFKGKGREVREELSHTSRETIQEGPSHYFLLVAAAYLTIPMQFGSEGNHVWHRWKARYSQNFDRVWDPGVSSFFITLRSRFLEGEGFDIGNELRRVAREKEISCWTRGRS